MADSDSSEDIVSPPTIGVRMDHIRYAISLLGLKVDVHTDEGRHALLARLQSTECIIARDRCRYVQSTTNKKRSIVACLMWLELLGFDGVIADRMLTYDILKTMLTESSGLCPSEMTVSTSTGRSTGKATREQCCVHPHHYIRGNGVAALKAYMTSLKEVLAAVPGSAARIDPALIPRLQAILAAGNGIFDVPRELLGACSLAVFTVEERAYKSINRRPGRRGHHEVDTNSSEELVKVDTAAPPACKSAQGSPAPRRRKVTVDSPARPAATATATATAVAVLPPAVRAGSAGSATVLHTHEETTQTPADPFSTGISLPPFLFGSEATDTHQRPSFFEQLAHELLEAPSHSEQHAQHQRHPEQHALHHPEQHSLHHPKRHSLHSEQHAQYEHHPEQDPLLDMYDAYFVNFDYSVDVLRPRAGLAMMAPPLARAHSHQSLPPAMLLGWDDGSQAFSAASPQRSSHTMWAL